MVYKNKVVNGPPFLFNNLNNESLTDITCVSNFRRYQLPIAFYNNGIEIPIQYATTQLHCGYGTRDIIHSLLRVGANYWQTKTLVAEDFILCAHCFPYTNRNVCC